jgi:hypothetical protein
MGIWWVYNHDWMMGIEKNFRLNSITMSYNRSFQSRTSQDPAYESGPAGPAMKKSPSQQIPAGWSAAGLGILRSKNGWHKDMENRWTAWNPHPIAHQIDWFLITDFEWKLKRIRPLGIVGTLIASHLHTPQWRCNLPQPMINLKLGMV